MCGIAGFWRRDSLAAKAGELVPALNRLGHRGPDDEGFLTVDLSSRSVSEFSGDDSPKELSLPHWSTESGSGGHLILGHRRLSILDCSPAGHQPMASPDRQGWITFNGEIYNYVELREELKALGHPFHTGTDTEVILAAWREWGEACLPRFNGDWALAILDLREGREPFLFLARDRYGVKPLYYTHGDDGFWFASEIKALCGSAAPFVPNENAVRRFLLSGELPPGSGCATFFEGIHQLKPGESAIVRGPGPDQVEFRQWYDLRTESPPEPAVDEAAAITEMESQLTGAVRLRLRADVPVGSCLSGGLDSSAVVGTMRQLRGEAGEVHTFSAVYRDKGPFNEREWIDQVVEPTRSTPHFVFPDDASLGDDFDRMVWHQDEPFQTASIFAQWCVMETARREGVTVLLDGQAADELLAGYQPGTCQEQFLEWIQTGQRRRFFREWRSRRKIAGLSWMAAIRELWQILVLGTTGVLAVAKDRIDPNARLAGLGFRPEMETQLYSGNETDYDALRAGLEEDLEKLSKWKNRLAERPEEAGELGEKLAKKQRQVQARRVKLARFDQQGTRTWRGKNLWKIIRCRMAGEPAHGLREHLIAQTLTSNLQHLLRFEDRNSMAHSIEARVPFTDHRLVEWAFARANEFKIREGWTKWVLRKAAGDRIPEKVLWRTDKVGFETPDGRMARRVLEDSPRDLEHSPFLLQYLRPEAIRERVASVIAGTATADEAKLVWRWLVLESWHRQFSGPGMKDKGR